MPSKKKIIIFDFNRTLYDPEHRVLMKEAREILRELIGREYQLHLLSTAEPSREALVRELDLEHYFESVTITDAKEKAFAAVLAKLQDFNREGSFVVGDQVKREICYGNRAGIQTVWLRAGKFAKDTPRSKEETPTHVIATLDALLKIIT